MKAVANSWRVRPFSRPAAGFIALIAAAWLLTGCVAVKLAVGKGGQDMSAIRPGITRGELETHLGAPVHSWVSETGIPYADYRFNRGVAPRPDMGALAVVVDALSVGIFELLFVNASDKRVYGPDEFGHLIVSFDADGRVIGLFDRFARLPPNGRSQALPSILRTQHTEP